MIKGPTHKPGAASLRSNWWNSFFGRNYLTMFGDKPQQTRQETAFIVRKLNLAKGAKVLDLCCGAGRHSIALAKQGFVVTGIDLSPHLLKQAKASAAKAKIYPRFVKRDMREIGLAREFDAVLSLFTSFGYFDDSGNERVIATVAKALKPGGQFFLDIWNKDHFVATLNERARPRDVNGGRLLQDYQYDAGNSVIVGTKRLITKGRSRAYRFFLRLYSLAEITEQMQRHSLEVVTTFGGYDGSAYTDESRRMIIIARKI